MNRVPVIAEQKGERISSGFLRAIVTEGQPGNSQLRQELEIPGID